MTSSATPLSQQTIDDKIAADLQVVADKLSLCESMLDTGSDSTDAPLQDVVGFLDACTPRLLELVEVAATQGALSEHVLMNCLSINDRLQKVLKRYDTLPVAGQKPAANDDDIDMFVNSPPPVSADAAAAAAASPDLFLQDETTSTAPSTNRNVVNDPFGVSVGATVPPPASAPPPPSIGQTKSEDEFDDFFTERTSAN